MTRPQFDYNLGGPERIQPMATPQGINAPVAGQGVSGLMALASSLSNLRPELNGLLANATTDYREREANRAYDTIQGMTFEEAKQAVQEGTMRQSESPWFRAAFQKQFGLSYAANRRREIITAYNNDFDKEGGNLDEFLAGYAQDDFNAYGNSEFIASGLREGMAGLFEEVRNNHATYVDSQLQARASEQFYTIAGETLTGAVEAGGDTNAAITAVVNQHMNAGLIDQNKADAALMGLAEKFANEGNVAAMNAVLDADPTGRGSFSTRAGFDLRASELRAGAQKMASEVGRAATVPDRVALEAKAKAGLLDETDMAQITSFQDTGVLTTADTESLIAANMAGVTKRQSAVAETNAMNDLRMGASQLVLGGQAFAVQDTTITLPDGSTKEVSGKELREMVVNEQVTALLSGENPNVALAAERLSSLAVPETYKPWEDILSNGLTSLTPAMTQPGPDGTVTIPQPAAQAYSLWKEMSGSEELRNRHTKDARSAAVFRDAEVLEAVGGMTPEAALKAAAGIDRSTSRSSLSFRMDADTFDEAVAGHLSGGLFGTDPVNGMIVRTAVEEHARILMDLGVPQDKAVEESLRTFDTSYTAVNGVFINTRDRFVPQNIEEISSAYVEDFLSKNPNYDEAYFVPDRQQDFWTFTDQFGRALTGAPTIHVSKLPAFLSERNRLLANEAITGNQ